MRLSVVLQGTHRGAPREERNPFDGTVETRAPDVMTGAELAAAMGLLARHGGTDIVLEGARLEVVGLREGGGLVKIDGDLDAACAFLFELATVGGLALRFAEGLAYATTTDVAKRWHELGHGPCLRVDSPKALTAALRERVRS